MQAILIAHSSLFYQFPAIILLIVSCLFALRFRSGLHPQSTTYLLLYLALTTLSTLAFNASASGFWALSWLFFSVILFVHGQGQGQEQQLTILTLFLLVEGSARLAARVAGHPALWLTPPGYGWRISLLSGDWGGWTGLLCIAAPFALNSMKGWRRTLLSLDLTIILFFSGSRGAWIAALGAASVSLWMTKGRGWTLLTLNLSLGAMLFATSSGLLFEDRGGVAAGVGSDTGRLSFHEVALKEIGNRPLFGNGAGNFEWAGGIYHPHNAILAILHESGVVGFFSFFLFLLSMRKRIERNLPTFVAFTFYAMFMTPIMSVQALFFWWLGGENEHSFSE
jgi:O-antigen ligase